MKKLLCLIVVLTLVSALFIFPAEAKATVTKVWFEGEYVKERAGADLSVLCDNKILSEENATANDFSKSGIVLVQNTNMMDGENNTTATLYLELDSLQDIDSVYITWYVYHQAIIGLPYNNNLIIGYSKDGEAYTEIATYDFEGETAPNGSTDSYQLETVIRLGTTVKAKYVSISFEYGPNGQSDWYCPMWEWVGFTEVGAGMMIDEVGGGTGYDEVSEDNTPIEEIEPIVEIPEGALALKHAKFNTSITTGSYTILTDPATMQNFNVKWTSCALLRPTETEGEYKVVAVNWLNGDDTFLFADAAEGDIVLSVHGDDDSDGTKANRLALTALETDDIVTFAGYNFEELTFETGAVVYFTDRTAVTKDTSDTEVSVPADDESSEAPADDESSEEPADDETSAPADDKSDSSSAPAGNEKDNNTGLIIGIVIGVVVIAAIVVVVIVVSKKKK